MPRKKQVKRESYGPDDEAAAAAAAKKAIDYIEAHLFEKLTATRVAKACAVSPYHFSRLFTKRQGEGVMAYVRGRRLDIAANRLIREPATSVVDIALDCRFESPAAFTRAFTRAYEMSPLKYRRAANRRVRRRRITMSLNLSLEQSLEFLDTFCVAGLVGRFEPGNYVRVPELWKAFGALSNFPGRLGGGETCGVFRDRDFVAQSFEHMAGARIESNTKVSGLEVWTLPGRRYLVITQHLTDGELHPQVAAAQAEIWGKRVPNSGRTLVRAPDFQIYPANFKVGPGGWIKYHIPVE